MRYFIEYNDDGTVYAVGIGPGGTEITQAEYEKEEAAILAKNELIVQVYKGEITIDEVPAEWQREVQNGVDSFIATMGEYDTQQISDAEAIHIITGGETA